MIYERGIQRIIDYVMLPSECCVVSDKVDARVRARTLLISRLSSEQERDLANKGRFTVFAGKGLARRRFWIENTAHAYNVKSLFFEYCVVTQGVVPIEDETLMRKLMIEHEPNTFFRIANCDFRKWVGAMLFGIGVFGAGFVIAVVGLNLYQVIGPFWMAAGVWFVGNSIVVWKILNK